MNYTILGIMSGSSLDGLDFALVRIKYTQEWKYQLLKAQTIKYPKNITDILTNMTKMTILEYTLNDNQYSKFIAQQVVDFVKGFQVDLIASHGHTILHQPQNGITLQCGNTTMIAALTGIDTVGNFRQLDVFRNGQGAPLVPFGSQLFQLQYKDIDVYLNLGGICNIDSKGIGWDIGFCNIYSNKLAQQLGKQYDQDGLLGQKGVLNSQLFQFLKSYNKVNDIKHEKSFGRQHFQQFVIEIDKSYPNVSIEDKLRTYYQYLSWIITENIRQIVRLKQIKKQIFNVLCTGGGAYNKFLIKLLNKSQTLNFIIPNNEVVEFKQAIIFAFLGLKFKENLKNCSKGIGGTLSKGLYFN